MKVSSKSLRRIAIAGAATTLAGGLVYQGYELQAYHREVQEAAARGEYVEPPAVIKVYDQVRRELGMGRIAPPPVCQLCGMG